MSDQPLPVVEEQKKAQTKGRKLPKPKTLKEVDVQFRELETQKKELAKVKKLLRAKEAKEEKAKQTRKKILIGAMILDTLAKKESFTVTEISLRVKLSKYLTRPQDRELFDLPPIEVVPPTS